MPVVPASSLSRISDTLRKRPASLSVDNLREMGQQIDKELRLGSRDEGLREAGLHASALFTATCSTRNDKEQEALLDIQDKLLARLRAVSTWLTIDLHRPVRAALLSLVTQAGFNKKRKGYRQHLVQALAEAACGPLPPSALLPILCAKETGPAAADLVLEVLERIVGDEDDGGDGLGRIGKDNASTKSVIELLHHVVAEVTTSGATKSRIRGGKVPRAHLMSFLVQACSTLPDYVLVFAKELLSLAESCSSSARKLSLHVLAAVLRNERMGHRRGGTPDPALVAVLRITRSDGDATVRCSAFDIVAEHIGQIESVSFQRDEDSCSSNHDKGDTKDSSDNTLRQLPTVVTNEARGFSGSSGGGKGGNYDGGNDIRALSIAPCEGRTFGHTHSETTLLPVGTRRARTGGVNNTSVMNKGQGDGLTATTQKTSVWTRGQVNEGGAECTWAEGGAVLSSVSAAVDALLNEGSKAVRAKALICLLRILEIHGSAVQPANYRYCSTDPEDVPAHPENTNKMLDAVGKGALEALEGIVADTVGGPQAFVGYAGGGRYRKAVDAARDLLALPCVTVVPVDLVLCYERCRVARGGREGATVASEEVRRALREVAQSRFCSDIGTLSNVVSDVMAAEATGAREDVEQQESFGDTDECSSFSLSQALCDVLAGVGDEVVASLFREGLGAYVAGDDMFGVHHDHVHQVRIGDAVLLRTLSLLAEANGEAVRPSGGGHASSGRPAKQEQLKVFAESQGLFWQRLERRMGDIERNAGQRRGGPRQGCQLDGDSEQLNVPHSGGFHGETGESHGKDGCDDQASTMSKTVSELSELLRVFQMLATRSLLSPENEVALEHLVFPAALTRRRLIRPAVGLALALNEPRRVLLSSLAILQDAAFSRSSSDIGRACDYVKLIGVLATENASLIAAHVRRQHEDAISRNAQDTQRHEDEGKAEDGQDDYMAGVSNREAMELEIRRLREASVTCDGMLSCYTPFLLAIVRCRAADLAAARSSPQLLVESVLEDDRLPCGSPTDGHSRNYDGVIRDNRDNKSKCVGGSSDPGGDGEGEASKHAVSQVDGRDELREAGCKESGTYRPCAVPPPHGASSPRCPRALCTEALMSLSEYAVLSPGLAEADVLPLARALATDTLEHAQIRIAAVRVMTRRELATDQIAASASGLLEDENPRLRQEVLGRLGCLINERRIQAVHLARLARMLADACHHVRRTAQAVFFKYLQPRPDEVNRCLFETFFTLDAEKPINRRVLKSLIAVAQRAAPGQGLESLGGALVRKAAETRDSEAAFFLSLVPPTVNSVEAAEVALRRGQLPQASPETISLVAEHFSKFAHRGGSWVSSSTTSGGGRNASPSKAHALEISERIRVLVARKNRAPSPPFHCATLQGRKMAPAARSRKGQNTTQISEQEEGEGGGAGHPVTSNFREGSSDRRKRRKERRQLKERGIQGRKKMRRSRGASTCRGGDNEVSRDADPRRAGTVKVTRQTTSRKASAEEELEEEREEERGEEEEEEWEG